MCMRWSPAEVAATSAPFSPSAPRPCSACWKHPTQQAGYVRIVALVPANAVGHRQTAHIMVGDASLQVSTPFCITMALSHLRCFCCTSFAHAGCSRRRDWCCVSVLSSATVPAPSWSVRGSSGCGASSCPASASLPRIRSSTSAPLLLASATQHCFQPAPWVRQCRSSSMVSV
jgi:hypothetical protein